MRTRWWEPAKSIALAVLVIASLVLSGYLWFGTPAPQPDLRTVPIVFEGDSSRAPASLLGPAAMIDVDGTGARRWSDPESPAFRAAWSAVRQAMAMVSPADLDKAPVETLSPRGAASGAATGGGAGSAPASASPDPLAKLPRLEADFLYGAPWSVWYTAVSGGACTSGDGPATAHVLLAAEGADAWLALGTGDTYQVVRLPGQAGLVRRALADVSPLAGEPVVQLVPQAPWSAVGPVWVPLRTPALPDLAVSDEFIPQGRPLPQAFFRDVEAVRRIDERAGVVVYTDGQSTLRADPAGGLSYDRAPASDQPVGFCTPVAVQEAASFVSTHGGWPKGGALLWQVRPVYPRGAFGQQADAPQSIVIQFAREVMGVPVAGPGGPLVVTIDSGGPAAYRRLAREIVGPLPSESSPGRRALAGPAQVLEALDRAWPTLYPDGHVERRVTDMRLVYFAGPSGPGRQILAPAWAVRFADGEEWALDAVTLEVLGSALWKP